MKIDSWRSTDHEKRSVTIVDPATSLRMSRIHSLHHLETDIFLSLSLSQRCLPYSTPIQPLLSAETSWSTHDATKQPFVKPFTRSCRAYRRYSPTQSEQFMYLFPGTLPETATATLNLDDQTLKISNLREYSSKALQ